MHIDVGAIKFNDFNPQRYIDWYKIPNYSLQVVHAGFVLTTNNFFFDILDKTVQKLLAAGLIDQIITDCILFEPNINIMNYPFTFTIDNLSFGFVIWFGCFVICCTVFIIEIVVWKIRRWKRIVAPLEKMNIESKQNRTRCNEEAKEEIQQFVKILIRIVDENMKK